MYSVVKKKVILFYNPEYLFESIGEKLSGISYKSILTLIFNSFIRGLLELNRKLHKTFDRVFIRLTLFHRIQSSVPTIVEPRKQV